LSIFHELAKKPWLTDQEGMIDHGAFLVPAGKVGLRVFLVVVSVVFTLVVIAYTYRMTYANWRPTPEPMALWLNTALLIASSVAMQWAKDSATRENMEGVRFGLILGGVLTLAFLIGQALVWRQLDGQGYYATSNLANAFFYLLTALHGLHLLGGLVAWGRSALRMWGGASASDLRLSVELCTTYWHYLLLIWLILFGLLLIS